MSEPKPSRSVEFLRGGGELGALIRARDWDDTPLGPPEAWPQSLKTAIQIMLTSRQPIWIGWGPELTYFYNDPYKAIIGGKHPWALGQPTRDVWGEIWDDIAPLLDQAIIDGEGTYTEAQLLIMERSGYPEETYYTFSYSPIPADDGSPGGIICANTDDTKRVVGERQLAFLRELGARMADARTWADACAGIQTALATDPQDITFAALYTFDPGTAGFQLAASCRIDAGGQSPDRWPLAQVLAGHEPLLVGDLADRLGAWPSCAAWPQPSARAALLPVRAAGDQCHPGVLVVGLNPYRLFDEEYRGFLNLAAGQIAATIANVEAYEQARRRADALAELDRAKTAFFSNVSHEFRTPLALMLGPLEEILAKPDAGAAADDRQLVEVAHRNGLRLMKLVNALLDFSRIEAGRIDASFQPTDLASYTADIASSFRSATNRAGLGLVVDAPPLSQFVYVDREKWEKVVVNLLSNAYKFTFEGEIRVELREAGDCVQLTVRDTGIGIAADQLPRLFERFHRVEGARGRSFEGSGIGLALVHELVRIHGGQVSVQSQPGEGSAFTVVLPLGSDHLAGQHIVENEAVNASVSRAHAFYEEALHWLPDEPREEESAADIAGGADAKVATGRPRIVLADDNADMRDYVRRLLASRFNVEAVADGEAALAAIRRDPPDLLMTDVMMPRLDGFGLLRIIREDEALKHLSVVMLSARAGEEARIEGIEAGADDYLVKPFSAREMIARVTTNLAMSRVRRDAEAALRELNQQLSSETDRLNHMFEVAPTLMAVLRGPEHVFELANPVYLDLVGNRDIIGKPIRQALPEISDQGFVDVLDTVYRTGEPFVARGATVNLARNSDLALDERVLDFAYQPLTDAEGKISGIFVQGSDVTDRVHAEGILADQNRILERLNQAGAALAGELELERVVQLVTDAGVELTGAGFGAFFYNTVDASGESYVLYTLSGAERALFEQFPMPRNTAIFAPTFSGTSVVRSDDITQDERYGRNAPHRGMPEGHLPVCSYLAVPVVSRAGEVIGGLFFGHSEKGRFTPVHEQLMLGLAGQAATAIDNARLFDAAQREIHDRGLAEAALRDLNNSLEERIATAIAERAEIEEALRQAQKMEAVGQLTGGIAHDFNNLLTIITGNMDMALRSLSEEEENARLRRAIGNALKGAERAASLTQRLLAFSRRQPLAPQALDVDRLIQGMSELLKRTLGETVHLETVTAPGLWRVEADPNQLESSLLNLAVNARDAMPAGGKLTIETANAWLDECYTSGQAEVAPGSYVVITVSDTGSGMPREMLARVFEPFFTTKEIGKGTGLGLSMVYGFVKQSGGHIRIYSEEGEGTAVKVYLPRLVGYVAEANEENAEPVSQASNGEAILVVEDDDDVRAYTVDILRELGYRVIEAHDGPAALWHIERTEVPIDLLFTDVVMAPMSGRELADAARAVRPHLKVLYTSGYTRNAIVHGGRLDPGVELIAKPFTFDALSAKVRDILDGGRSGRLLLIEDDANVRILTIEALTGAGYAIDEAANPTEALGRIRAAGGGYDAVVLDLDLPGDRATALAKEIRGLRKDLPIVLSSSGELDEPALLQDHGTRWIRKPYTIQSISEALSEMGVASPGNSP